MSKNNYYKIFKEGIIRGLAWSFGATIGFVLVSTILVFVLRKAGGLPLIGNFVASIVEATTDQLIKRTPLFPQ